ncbi:2-C-methyl-D-erythritol 4-phosphate cytidylyltransferase [Candidatus Hydrogenedentota bacterium]
MNESSFIDNRRVAVIVAAAGQGVRMGLGYPKAMMSIGGEAMLSMTVKTLSTVKECRDLVITAPPANVDEFSDEALKGWGLPFPPKVIPGGSTRQKSVLAALETASPDCDVIVIHDAARPLIDVDTVEESVSAAREHGASVVAVPAKDTVIEVDGDGFISETTDRSRFWLVQTPQTFRRDVILEAHRDARHSGFEATDDTALVRRLGGSVKVVEGKYNNIKVTTSDDVAVVENYLRTREKFL